MVGDAIPDHQHEIEDQKGHDRVREEDRTRPVEPWEVPARKAREEDGEGSEREHTLVEAEPGLAEADRIRAESKQRRETAHDNEGLADLSPAGFI